MLTYHGTCRGKRVTVSDDIDRSCVIPLIDECHITGNIYMSRTQSDARNSLVNVLDAALVLDMALILIREFLKAVENRIRSNYAYSAVSGL